MSARRGKPKPLRYYGGKSGYGKAAWINSLLPAPSPDQLYDEPFCGMAGVLLDREPMGLEIINDIDERVINWWECVLYETEKFAWMVEYTPYSRRLFERAIEQQDDMSLPPIRRAHAFHIVTTQSMAQGAEGRTWAAQYNPSVGSIKTAGWEGGGRMRRLANRMRYVQMECRPAIDELARTAECAYAVVYCDPPYPTANTSPYRYGDIDIPELTEALLAQKGFVAISGYGDEWTHLGWHRHERKALRRQINGRGEPRVEVVWTNQRPPQYLL